MQNYKPPSPERDTQIVKTYSEGASLKELSEAFGLSTTRIRTILKKHGVYRYLNPPPPPYVRGMCRNGLHPKTGKGHCEPCEKEGKRRNRQRRQKRDNPNLEARRWFAAVKVAAHLESSHGKRDNYGRGCRCDKCKAANRAYMRSLKGKPPPTHGLSGYQNYACRCDVCKTARNEYQNSLKGKPPPTHGLHGYTNYGCRCDVCRAAHSASYRKHRELSNGRP